MKVLVVGGGGREHVLVWKLAQSHVTEIFCAPGNGGTAKELKCRNAPIKANDIAALAKFAEEERIDLTVVGSEQPLCDGIVDQWPKGLRIWGPKANQARLEGSKVYAKLLMARLGIPTAPFEICDTMLAARDAIAKFPGGRCVIKADGLAGGKGAIPCHDSAEAEQAAYEMLIEEKLGTAGKRIIVEDYLEGWETSLMVLCAGGELIPLATAQDYKRIHDGDQGPNTGGMGSFSPVDRFTPELLEQTLRKIVRPIVAATDFRGVLYVGLMITEEGPQVLEFNVRFGDPESQVVLPRLRADLAELLYGGATDHFPTTPVEWSEEVAVTVVMAAQGYPGKPQTGGIIRGLEVIKKELPRIIVFHAGTKLNECGETVVAGGRVLNITAMNVNQGLARAGAYLAISEIGWTGEQHRTDIAK